MSTSQDGTALYHVDWFGLFPAGNRCAWSTICERRLASLAHLDWFAKVVEWHVFMLRRQKIVSGGAGLIILAALGVGYLVGRHGLAEYPIVVEVADVRPTYSSGLQTKEYFDRAYDEAQGTPVAGVMSGLSAHHLLIGSDIATVFEDLASDEVKTVVLVSPNHFARGRSVAQVSKGQWSTPYGTVMTDDDAVDELLAANLMLRHEEVAYENEHGIFGLTPFVKRSFPNAKIVSIILDDRLSAEDAWQLGQEIASTLPKAVLIASVDMTHYHDVDYTAANDEKVLQLLADGGMCGVTPCTAELDVDSNASLRVLFGFNAEHGAQSWYLTHHGSSLAMGATRDWHDNTSHILGYFLGNK